ncbi:hypothetical protein [Pseudomonas nitroreducens]|uniref:hypothetical protein n=1 Tax=Pseudomonas nitroreducens TaxID=46680 RepID=UPI0038208F83
MKSKTYDQEILAAYDSVNLESDEWTVIVEANDDLLRHSINFRMLPINEIMRALAKSTLSKILADLHYGEGNPVRSGFVKTSKSVILLLSVFERLHPNKLISELNQNSLEAWVATAVYHHIVKSSDGGLSTLKFNQEPFHKGYLTSLISAFRHLYKSYQEGINPDGPERLVTQPVITNILKSDIETLNLDFQEWMNSKNYGSIPFVVANLLMCDAIEMIRSLRTKQLIEYFKIYRESGRPDLIKKLWVSSKNSIKLYRFTTNIEYLYRAFGGDSRKMLDCKKLILIPLDESFREMCGASYKFPWPRYLDLQRDYQNALIACYIVFLFVMGKRGGEVRPLCANDIHIPECRSNSATYSSRNFKTNQGTPSTQGVTDSIAEALETLLNLSYSDIRGTDAPLFTCIPYIDDVAKLNGKISTSHFARLLQDYYEGFIQRAESRIEINIKDIHPNISAHQFRHTFAEFSLRRFDGNVEELLRQTFRHGDHTKWIKNYTADKLDEETKQRLNKEYIMELIPRILRDQESLGHDYVGGMAAYINSAIRPRTLHMSPSEFEKYIYEVAEDYISITPHEYGWCLLHRIFATQAKCSKDGVTPNPRGTTAKNCNGCINFVSSRKAHLSAQRQIAITHLDFIESKFWKLPELKLASILAVQDSQRLFPELKDLGEI